MIIFDEGSGRNNMKLEEYLRCPEGNPLEELVSDGGFCGIFRTIGCIGDSLSSGEFESLDEAGNKGYHDYYDYSWGQYLARMAGCKVYNFSRGGMTAKEYWESFAESQDFWNPDKVCQAYILALGLNDLFWKCDPIGSLEDIDWDNYENNAPTFTGYYARIIQRLKTMQPKAKFFLMTIPPQEEEQWRQEMKDQHAEILRGMAEKFQYTYVLDFRKYAPIYDEEFKRRFFLGGHMNPSGYLLTAKMVASYIDYLIRSYPEDFSQVGFIGTPFHNVSAPW